MISLRIGIVGTGFIGSRHIDAIRRIPGLKIVAVADAFLEKAQQTAELLEGANAYADIDEMLKNETLDAIHNCTPTNMHYMVNKKVIEAGKHLYCEKPLALNVDEAEKLQELLKKHPVANGINLNYRMNALVQDMHEKVKKGEAGRPFLVTASYVQDWMMKSDDFDWRLDPAVGGASRAIADIGSHLFDLSQYVMGKRISAVNACLTIVHPFRQKYEKTGGTFSKEKGKLLDEIKVINEDAAAIIVRFEDGTQGLFQVSQISAGHKNDMRIRFDFEKCSYEWRQEENNLLYIGYRDEANQIKHREPNSIDEKARAYTQLPAGHPEGWGDVLYQSIKSFYRSIEDQSYLKQDVSYATVAEGAWIMKIIEACLESDRKRQWVDIIGSQNLEPVCQC